MATPEVSIPTPAVDTELVDRLRKGDEVAFEMLYERYFKRVYHFIDKRLNNRADTEETTQEVFINIFSSIDSFRGEAPFAAWVFGVTRRTIAARFKRRRHPTVPLGDEEPEQVSPMLGNLSTTPSPLEDYECRERAAHLKSVIHEHLSTEQRLLFQLHHLDDRPISEIARTLDRSENAVKSSLYRTRKLLLSR